MTREITATKQELPLPSPTSKHRCSRFLHSCLARFGTMSLRYWAHAFTVLLGIIVLTALLIPVLSYLGFDVIAKPLFFALHAMCAQIPSHSFYIFGHQLGLCQRNLAIYSSMLLGSLVFLFTNKRLPGISWWIWLLMLLPMAWDGTTQLFGWRESTWELRVVTGTLFGGETVWFVLPLLQKMLVGTHALQSKQATSSKFPGEAPFSWQRSTEHDPPTVCEKLSQPET